MNKYETIRRQINANNLGGSNQRYLQELIERATPKKLLHQRGLSYLCPICNESQHSVGMDYCYNCGQALDWSDR